MTIRSELSIQTASWVISGHTTEGSPFSLNLSAVNHLPVKSQPSRVYFLVLLGCWYDYCNKDPGLLRVK